MSKYYNMTEQYNNHDLSLNEEADSIKIDPISIGGAAIELIISSQMEALKETENEALQELQQETLKEEKRQEDIIRRKKMYQTGNHSYTDEEVWKLNAECYGMDASLFYTSDDKKRLQSAVKVCGSCAVRNECDEYGSKHSNGFGVWGGKNKNSKRIRLTSN